jgi:hypothetical protein
MVSGGILCRCLLSHCVEEGLTCLDRLAQFRFGVRKYSLPHERNLDSLLLFNALYRCAPKEHTQTPANPRREHVQSELCLCCTMCTDSAQTGWYERAHETTPRIRDGVSLQLKQQVIKTSEWRVRGKVDLLSPNRFQNRRFEQESYVMVSRLVSFGFKCNMKMVSIHTDSHLLITECLEAVVKRWIRCRRTTRESRAWQVIHESGQ